MQPSRRERVSVSNINAVELGGAEAAVRIHSMFMTRPNASSAAAAADDESFASAWNGNRPSSDQ